MIVFPSMLLEPAAKAGIKTPTPVNDNDDWWWNLEEFPHFSVFCIVQLCRPMKMDGEQWRNAKVIAAISEENIKEVTLTELISMGLEYQT